MEGTNWAQATLCRADLLGVDLNASHLDTADLSYARLDQSVRTCPALQSTRLHKAQYPDAPQPLPLDLSSQDLSALNLPAADAYSGIALQRGARGFRVRIRAVRVQNWPGIALIGDLRFEKLGGLSPIQLLPGKTRKGVAPAAD